MRRAMLTAAGTALVLAACGGGSGGDSGSAAPAPAENAASDVASTDTAGRPVQLAAGGTVDLDSFAGQDVLFWFWAPW